MGIGAKIEQSPQLQEFAERLMTYIFDLARYGGLFIDDITVEMGITTDEVWNLFEQLGYSREEE